MTRKHPYSHLRDDYWTTSAPGAAAMVPESQPVLDVVNEAQGETADAPAVVEDEPKTRARKS